MKVCKFLNKRINNSIYVSITDLSGLVSHSAPGDIIRLSYLLFFWLQWLMLSPLKKKKKKVVILDLDDVHFKYLANADNIWNSNNFDVK